LIAARGKGEEKSSTKPVMLIDENGLDHAFCTGKLSPGMSLQLKKTKIYKSQDKVRQLRRR
jgi:hypothetical protein